MPLKSLHGHSPPFSPRHTLQRLGGFSDHGHISRLLPQPVTSFFGLMSGGGPWTFQSQGMPTLPIPGCTASFNGSNHHHSLPQVSYKCKPQPCSFWQSPSSGSKWIPYYLNPPLFKLDLYSGKLISSPPSPPPAPSCLPRAEYFSALQQFACLNSSVTATLRWLLQ